MTVNTDDEEEEETGERGSPTERTALDNPKSVPGYLRNAPLKRIRHQSEKRLLPTVLVSSVFVIAGLAFGLPAVVALTTIVAVASIFRLVVATWCCCCSWSSGVRRMVETYGCKSFLSATDVFWLHDTNFNCYVAHCLFFVERPFDVRTAREILQNRVIDKTNEYGDRAFVRFTQKIVPAYTGYHWVEDEDFDIKKHVFEESRPVRTHHQLRALLSCLMTHQPLERNRPLWEVRIVKNFGNARDTVLIVRLHHALSDGVTFMKILVNCLADQPLNMRMKPRWGGTTFPLNVLRAAVVGPITVLWWLFKRRDYNPLSHRQPMSSKRSVKWSLGLLRLATIDRICQVTHCTVNDVLMAAARGAVRDYFKYHHGLYCPPNVTVSVPVDLRFEPSSPESMGTGFVTVNARLPTNVDGSIPGLWETRRCMDMLKSSADAVVMYGSIFYFLTILPARFGRWLISAVLKPATLSFNNLPGPERTLTLSSCRLKSLAFWMNSHPGVPLSICALSYAGAFNVTVSVDSSAVQSPGRILKSFVAHVERMYSIVAKRKVPGLERRRSSFSAERRWEEVLKPSIAEIQSRLQIVQAELHEISRKLELLVSMPTCAQVANGGSSSSNGGNPSEVALFRGVLTRRMEELKEEFVELITELRKRKTFPASNATAIDMEAVHYDHDLDGQLRLPRRASDTRRPVGLYAFSALLSTSRPLLTQPSNMHDIPSDPDVPGGGGTPEQQRALLASRNINAKDHSSRPLNIVSHRRENLL